MNKIDISNFITSIENTFMDNGMMFEVECVTPEEVEDDVRYNDTFRTLSRNTNLINEESYWVKIAYGDTYAYVGVKRGNEKLEVLVDNNEECPIEDIEQMIVEGIRSYAHAAGIETVDIKRGGNQKKY